MGLERGEKAKANDDFGIGHMPQNGLLTRKGMKKVRVSPTVRHKKFTTQEQRGTIILVPLHVHTMATDARYHTGGICLGKNVF